ncbi:hypothetical protein [Prodigiosinella confusarubida]|nr:hypothetical protein [Serratia sp. ATCC 39006]
MLKSTEKKLNQHYSEEKEDDCSYSRIRSWSSLVGRWSQSEQLTVLERVD